MCSKAKAYEAPKVTITNLCSNQCLLITSNEGLGYEDLFSQAPNPLLINEESFESIP